MEFDPRKISASINERGFDRTVQVWTGREIDVLQYIGSEDEVIVGVD